METLEAIRKRKATRLFKDKDISEEDLEKILKAGMSAPVGLGAYDSLHLTVVKDKGIIDYIGQEISNMISKRMGKEVNKKFNEPVLIVLSSLPAMLPGLEQLNAGCVMENMAIAATSLGIDNVIHAAGCGLINNSQELLKKMKIKEGYKVVLCISLGYAQNEENPKVHLIDVTRI